jgi:hypothetical protein
MRELPIWLYPHSLRRLFFYESFVVPQLKNLLYTKAEDIAIALLDLLSI